MTELDLKNVYLRSSDHGKTWKHVSADGFKSCMNGVVLEVQTASRDGTIVRGDWGITFRTTRTFPRRATCSARPMGPRRGESRKFCSILKSIPRGPSEFDSSATVV
jgi:hypothetical protein